jgi:hypothetical protein
MFSVVFITSASIILTLATLQVVYICVTNTNSEIQLVYANVIEVALMKMSCQVGDHVQEFMFHPDIAAQCCAHFKNYHADFDKFILHIMHDKVHRVSDSNGVVVDLHS